MRDGLGSASHRMLSAYSPALRGRAAAGGFAVELNECPAGSPLAAVSRETFYAAPTASFRRDSRRR
jgi:hypothetical protein